MCEKTVSEVSSILPYLLSFLNQPKDSVQFVNH